MQSELSRRTLLDKFGMATARRGGRRVAEAALRIHMTNKDGVSVYFVPNRLSANWNQGPQKENDA